MSVASLSRFCLLSDKWIGTLTRLLRNILPSTSVDALDPHIHPFDLQHQVDTSGFIEGPLLATGHPHDPYNTAYYAMSPSRFRFAIDRWQRDIPAGAVDAYTFVDLGCGKGRAVLMASTHPFRAVIGVELHPDLAHIARNNLLPWRAQGHAAGPVTILCQDATEFEFPEGPCLVYLFHPFAGPVMHSLLGSLQRQFQQRPCLLDLIYFNPEAGEIIDRHPGFQHRWTEVLSLSEEDAAADPLAHHGDGCSAYRWIGLHAGAS